MLVYVYVYSIYIDAKLLGAPWGRNEKLVLLILLYYYRHGIYSVSELIYEENNYYRLQRDVYFSHYIRYLLIYIYDFQRHYNCQPYTVNLYMMHIEQWRRISAYTQTYITHVHIYIRRRSLVNNKILFPFSVDKKKEKEKEIIHIIFVWLRHSCARFVSFWWSSLKITTVPPRDQTDIRCEVNEEGEVEKKIIIIITFDFVVVCTQQTRWIVILI